jgi:succinyl-diaminopimelate desuccinylase
MKEISREEIAHASEQYRDELLQFCKELINTPSVNGQHSEKEIARVVAERASKLGLPSQLVALDEARPNVVVGTNFAKKSGLLFVAHLDTVPTGDESSWKYLPFSGEMEDGKMFGRGAIDCKAGVALSIYALKILYDLDKAEVAKFVGVVDEESGADSRLGAQYLLDKGLNAQAAIYTYPGIETVTIGHRGVVRLWIQVQGESAHTGSKHWQEGTKGANAIEALARFINSLNEVRLEGTHNAFAGYSFKHTPTLIQGGSGESIVPDQAKLLLDARLLPDHNNEVYIDAVRELAKRFTADKIRFDVEVKTNIPGIALSRDEKIVQILKKLDEQVMGIIPELQGAGPACEGYMFVQAGIPTICGFGAEGEGVHAANEYVKLDSLPKILEMYVRAAIELSQK